MPEMPALPVEEQNLPLPMSVANFPTPPTLTGASFTKLFSWHGFSGLLGGDLIELPTARDFGSLLVIYRLATALIGSTYRAEPDNREVFGQSPPVLASSIIGDIHFDEVRILGGDSIFAAINVQSGGFGIVWGVPKGSPAVGILPS